MYNRIELEKHKGLARALRDVDRALRDIERHIGVDVPKSHPVSRQLERLLKPRGCIDSLRWELDADMARARSKPTSFYYPWPED